MERGEVSGVTVRHDFKNNIAVMVVRLAACCVLALAGCSDSINPGAPVVVPSDTWQPPTLTEAAVLADRILRREDDSLLLDAAERRELAREIAPVLSRIRDAYPAVADINVRSPYAFGELLLTLEPWLFEAVSSLLDDQTGPVVLRTGHVEFDALNERLGLSVVGATCRIACTSGIFFLRVKRGAGSGADWWTLGPLSDSVELSKTESGGTTPMALREILSSYWSCFQALLFPQLEETIGALGERHQRFVMVLEWVRVETLLPYQHRRRGCPPSDRAALARAFIAKAVFALVSTRMLLDRLRHDSTLRRLCGWRSVKHIPSEATFSRAFAEFADSALPSHLHEALIKRTQGERLAGHISRDSTAIEGRERPTPKAPQPAKPKRRRGRPRKGEERPTEPRRLERQRNMTLPEMLADLPYACDIGVKRDAKGYQTSWSGYKLHIDAADGAIPVSCLLTSASLHDSQVAIPLATLTAERVRNLYDLMDSAYDAPEIRAHSRALGHVAIIDVNPRSGARKQALRQERQARRACGLVLSEERRYHERSTVERVNGRLKDEFGGRSVRVRGHAKVLCHLMFGIVALTVDQLMRLVT